MMTNEQAIAILKDISSRYPCSLESTFKDECEQIALNMAIQALNTQESLEKKIEFLMNKRPHGNWFDCIDAGTLKARHGDYVLYKVDFLLDHLAREVYIMEGARRMKGGEE